MEDLKLDDYSKIKPYLDMANYEGYNSNFVTMMMWNHEYHISYEIHDHFLVMLHNYKGTFFWAMPFTSQLYYQEAIDFMIDYSQKHDFDFIIDCAIEEFVNTIKPLYKDCLIFERTPYNDDYVYDRQMLETLSGKKMQKRRNHYNAFLRDYPNYVYRDLDLTNDFDIILNCLNRWEYEKDDISESMTSEIRGIMFLLSSKQILEFEVGGIFIDGQMEAFIIASRLKHSTIQIHVEKANKEIRGLYPAILKEMLEHHYPDEQYVNREEDMGLENLRKSKLSLHPLKMINKYRVSLKNIVINQAEDCDLDDIKDLWKANFKDETIESTDFYFQNIYQKEWTYVLKNNDLIISVVQIVPMTICKNNYENKIYFILGVCTRETFEGQGYMRQLMEYVLDKYKKEVIYLQAYVPDIYKKFGFYASHYHQVITVDKEALIDNKLEPSIANASTLLNYYSIFTSNLDDYRVRDESYWSLYLKRCTAFDDHILLFDDYGYIVYHEDEEQIYISELIYLNDKAIAPILSYFKDSQKELIVECDMNVTIQGKRNTIITMMSNQLSKDMCDKHKYINEIY